MPSGKPARGVVAGGAENLGPRLGRLKAGTGRDRDLLDIGDLLALDE
jgi:hypothetical protein